MWFQRWMLWMDAKANVAVILYAHEFHKMIREINFIKLVHQHLCGGQGRGESVTQVPLWACRKRWWQKEAWAQDQWHSQVKEKAEETDKWNQTADWMAEACRIRTGEGKSLEKGNLEYVEATEKLEGKRSRGRLRKIMLDRMLFWHGGICVSEKIDNTWDGRLWADMLTCANWHGPWEGKEELQKSVNLKH